MSCQPSATRLQGGCVGDNSGIEAGFTFSLGGRPSAVALPEQVRRWLKEGSGLCELLIQTSSLPGCS